MGEAHHRTPVESDPHVAQQHPPGGPMRWRTTPMPPHWDHTRARILHRDHHTCTHCGAHATHVDHVTPAHLRGPDIDSNLAALCAGCHASKTGREAQARQPRRARDPEPHPGLTAGH